MVVLIAATAAILVGALVVWALYAGSKQCHPQSKFPATLIRGFLRRVS